MPLLFCPDYEETQKRINHNFRCVTTAFEQVLSQAQAKGDIKRDRAFTYFSKAANKSS